MSPVEALAAVLLLGGALLGIGGGVGLPRFPDFYTRLHAAGIAVESGLCADEAAEINAGFFQRVRLGRPLVTLKLASSLDGRIATASGESRWITGSEARERTHLLRSPTWQQRMPMLGHASPLSDPEKMEAYRSLFRELGGELQRMLEDPRFVLRFMAAAATAGLRSSVLREAPSREPKQ